METFLFELVVLTVLTTVAATASAFDTKAFYQQQERYHY
jgi:hypothetical protein